MGYRVLGLHFGDKDECFSQLQNCNRALFLCEFGKRRVGRVGCGGELKLPRFDFSVMAIYND